MNKMGGSIYYAERYTNKKGGWSIYYAVRYKKLITIDRSNLFSSIKYMNKIGGAFIMQRGI